MRLIKIKTQLIARHIRGDKEIGKRVVKNKVITDAFVNNIVDNLIAETTAFGDYKFHGSGTGSVAENAADTALGTEVETRDTGTQVEVSANQYRSVATHTYAATFAITEHGLFNVVTVGVLMDRTVFTAINVVSGDKIEFTFTITFSSGG